MRQSAGRCRREENFPKKQNPNPFRNERNTGSVFCLTRRELRQKQILHKRRKRVDQLSAYIATSSSLPAAFNSESHAA